jgi:flagellar hook-length control protein FliK
MSPAVSPVSSPAPQASTPTPAPKGPNGFAQMLSDAVQPQPQAPAPAEAEAAPASADAEAKAPTVSDDPKNTRPVRAADPAPGKPAKTVRATDGKFAKADKSDKTDVADADKRLRSDKKERVKAPEADASAAAQPAPIVPQPEQKPVDVAAVVQAAVAQTVVPKDAEAVVPQGEDTEKSAGKGQRPLRIGAGEGDGAASRGRAAEKTEARQPEAATRGETNAPSASAWQAAAERVALPINGEAAKAEVSALDAAAGANAALAAPVAAKPAEVAAAPIQVPVPVTSPEFPQALGVQISVLARDGIQQAELHLNPAEMGPVSIQIAIEGTQAQVNFGADSAVTRNAIESGLPELATALREAGFTLSGGGVHQQASGRREGGNESGAGFSRSGDRASGIADAPAATSVTLHGRTAAGGIDVYA